MLWAMIRAAPAARAASTRMARALAAQAVVEREVALDLARVDPRRDRGELVDHGVGRAPRRPRSRTASASSASASDRLGARARAARSSFAGERVMPVTSWPAAEQQRHQRGGRSRRWRRRGRPSCGGARTPRRSPPLRAGAVAAVRRAHTMPSLKPADADAERAVEARAHVLQRRSRSSSSTSWALVEARAQRARTARRDDRTGVRLMPTA